MVSVLVGFIFEVNFLSGSEFFRGKYDLLLINVFSPTVKG